jgi:hypothetical protein
MVEKRGFGDWGMGTRGSRVGENEFEFEFGEF